MYSNDFFHFLQDDKLKRTNVANAMLGLSLILYPNTRQYGSVVMNGYKGFKALIHNAQEFPEVGGKGFAIGSGKEVFVGIGAQYITATEEVEYMSYERRNCIKKDEAVPGVEMVVFANYDEKACLMECNAKRLDKECGCLPYYYPNFEHVWNTTTCNLTGKNVIHTTYTLHLIFDEFQHF